MSTQPLEQREAQAIDASLSGCIDKVSFFFVLTSTFFVCALLLAEIDTRTFSIPVFLYFFCVGFFVSSVAIYLLRKTRRVWIRHGYEMGPTTLSLKLSATTTFTHLLAIDIYVLSFCALVVHGLLHLLDNAFDLPADLLYAARALTTVFLIVVLCRNSLRLWREMKSSAGVLSLLIAKQSDSVSVHLAICGVLPPGSTVSSWQLEVRSLDRHQVNPDLADFMLVEKAEVRADGAPTMVRQCSSPAGQALVNLLRQPKFWSVGFNTSGRITLVRLLCVAGTQRSRIFQWR